jgi:hypothetical protein
MATRSVRLIASPLVISHPSAAADQGRADYPSQHTIPAWNHCPARSSIAR